MHPRVDEITDPARIRRKKKPQQVVLVEPREHRGVEGQARRQHLVARAVDVHRQEAVQERDREVALIEQGQAIMLRDRASAGKTEAVTGSAAPEAASAAPQAGQVGARLHAALGQRVDSASVLSGLHPRWLYRPI